MDDTELHYVTYDPDAIWSEMMDAYIDAGGDILYPGDEKEMLLRSVLADIVQVFAGVDNALRMQTLRYAVGDYLDVIGELRDCERIMATPAKATVTITTNATGQSGTLAAGSAMTADGEVFYSLDEDLPLTGQVQTVTVDVTADRTGIAGNGLLTGTPMQLASTNTAINSIVAASDAVGGQEKESDDAYRERIRQHGLANTTSGPAALYESMAKAVTSQIVDAKAIKLGDGQVGVYLLLSDASGSAAIIQAVSDALSPQDVRPLTDEVSVALATAVNYTLNVQYTLDATVSISALTEAVKEYQAWQDQTIGRAWNPDRLMAMLYQAGATRVIWGAGSGIGGGSDVEYTEIDNDEYCSGTISLTAITE